MRAGGCAVRIARLTTIASLVVLLAQGAAADVPQPKFPESRYRVAIPNEPCDVVLTPADANAMLRVRFADMNKRVFCFEPGDYRAAGRLQLGVGGRMGAPKVLRFHGDPGVHALHRGERAIFEGFFITGNWWVIQGLTIQPRLAEDNWFVTIQGGRHNVLDRNVIDGVEHPNTGNNVGVMIRGYGGNPATDNSVQANVIRNGDQTGNADDYFGVLIQAGLMAGEDNDRNRIVDNEIYDWGDAIAIGGTTADCSEPGRQHGTIIDGNDVYVTAAKRVDCATGARTPDGQCTCAENGIDVKSNPGPDPAQWTRITNNRAWGFRPTQNVVQCGGSGAIGQAIAAGSMCAGHVLVARNTITDSTIGVLAVGPRWVIAGNLLADIRLAKPTDANGSIAIFPSPYARDVDIQFNTVVGADNAYDDQSPDTDTRCNVVVDDAARMGGGGFRGANHATEHNFLYHAPPANIVGATNEVFPAAADSANDELCFWRRRWTGPEAVCVPWAATTAASTHAPAVASCNPELTEPFGMAPLSFVPEPAGALAGAAALAALGALARRRR
ncbi:MAG: hypothetical protein DCC71_16430 [Proteobacteria bacterium]|nr:MAG: hypothetical protein DCC71_16430 [Pseudomonadota bacterium]